ncbi:MAG: hypothetical protein JXA52_00135 [Planctomycetes bacterium]|nr:hypothetical protein [Planctomycetota bacterium]
MNESKKSAAFGKLGFFLSLYTWGVYFFLIAIYAIIKPGYGVPEEVMLGLLSPSLLTIPASILLGIMGIIKGERKLYSILAIMLGSVPLLIYILFIFFIRF